MKVPFLDLSPVNEAVKADYLREVSDFLDRGQYILSPEVENFENSWAEYVRVKHCVGVSSGADALYLSLVANGVGQGDEVIIQGNAYNACVTAIMRVGATPRFVDIDPQSLTIDVSKIEHLVNKKTKAIMIVHLFGLATSMKEVMAVAQEFGLKVIEDCAQAHGARFDEKHVGTFGNAGAFSFYPTKNLGAFGDAGAVITDDENIYHELKARRNLGQLDKNNHKYFGLNMRLDPIQAIALSLKLKNFKEVTNERIKAGDYYNNLIKELDIPINYIESPDASTNVFHLYVVWNYSPGRGELQRVLSEKGIDTAVHYPLPVYEQPFFINTGKKDPCPVTDRVLENIISLPMFYGITREQQEYVVETLASILRA